VHSGDDTIGITVAPPHGHGRAGSLGAATRGAKEQAHADKGPAPTHCSSLGQLRTTDSLSLSRALIA
jgi:hypothetical protein